MQIIINDVSHPSLDFEKYVVHDIPQVSYLTEDIKFLSKELSISDFSLNVYTLKLPWWCMGSVAQSYEWKGPNLGLFLAERLFTNPDMTPYLLTIAHEMVHIKQWIKGDLTLGFFKDKTNYEFLWKNSVYTPETIEFIRSRNLDRHHLPWEKEAYSLEMPLAKSLLAHLKTNRKASNSFRQ